MNTLVFLHGWGADGNIWRRQVEAFSGQGFTVLSPSFPVWEVPWLVDYLQELPLAETVLVGWSLGGMLLLEALAQKPLEPAGLVLVATPASFCQRSDHPFGQPPAVVRALRRAVRVDARRGLADFASRCLAPGEANFQGQLLQEFQPRAQGADLAAGLDYLLHADLRPRLSRVPDGALVIQGEKDAIVPPAQADLLGQHLKNAQIVRFPEAGHVPFFTRAEKFSEVIEDFLREGARRRGLLPPLQTSSPNPLRDERLGGEK
jgi:pimeloyl-[acyl-carrier protein] methyl ester esterase